MCSDLLEKLFGLGERWPCVEHSGGRTWRKMCVAEISVLFTDHWSSGSCMIEISSTFPITSSEFSRQWPLCGYHTDNNNNGSTVTSYLHLFRRVEFKHYLWWEWILSFYDVFLCSCSMMQFFQICVFSLPAKLCNTRQCHTKLIHLKPLL